MLQPRVARPLLEYQVCRGSRNEIVEQVAPGAGHGWIPDDPFTHHSPLTRSSALVVDCLAPAKRVSEASHQGGVLGPLNMLAAEEWDGGGAQDSVSVGFEENPFLRVSKREKPPPREIALVSYNNTMTLHSAVEIPPFVAPRHPK